MSGSDGPTVARFRVTDMDCPSCVAKIEGHLLAVEGVERVTGTPVSRTLTVEHGEEVAPPELRDAVGRLGYTALHLDGEEETAPEVPVLRTRAARRTYLAVALTAAGLTLGWTGPEAVLFSLPLYPVTLPDLFFLVAAAVGGTNFFSKGLRALLARSLDMNFLMTVAILGAAAVGETMEAAAIAFLFSLAELLERYAADRARTSVTALLELAPETARLLREGEEVVVSAESLVPGDRVVVRPGERVPADGVVAAGRSAVDQSPITGESMPVDKAEGDEVFAGSINREGALEVDVSREASRSTLARIVRLVEEAERRKSRTEHFVERFARYYTPAVTAAAVLVVAVPTLLGAPFVPWLVRGLTLLVIACPCALVISTPVTVVSGITAAARNGVLIKGGIHLEAMGQARAVVFDKTGTLTVGHPRVAALHPVPGVEENELLARAAAVEARSPHPIARAVVDAAEERGLNVPAAEDYRSPTGAGAEAVIDGVVHRVMRPGALSVEVELPAEHRRAGRTVVGVEAGGELLGWLVLADEPREAARASIAGLRREGIGHVAMLTGDHEVTARAIAERVGVDQIEAGLLPHEKSEAVTALEKELGPVVMVGDGVNDAPALAAATVGVAMGAAGSDTALETADIALMGDDLSRLPYLARLSRRARSVIRQNVAAAILVKSVLALGIPFGMVSLVTAVLVGDMGLSLVVILNALRLGSVEG